jgi:hypothetical protein
MKKQQTPGTVFIDGFPVFLPNYVQDGESFYISYNKHDSRIYGGDTTALVKGQMEKFYILNGDHRAEYAALIPSGFSACLDYFKANAAKINKFSDRLIETEQLTTLFA